MSNRVNIIISFISFLLIFICLPDVNASIIEVNRELENVNISSEILVVEDATCELSIEEIIEDKDLNFALSDNLTYDFFLFNRIKSCPWINFKLVNVDTHTVNFYLNVDNYGLSRVNWYTFNRGKLVNEILTGDNLVFSDRPVNDLNYLLPIEIPPGDTLNCFLNLYRGSTIIFTNLNLQSAEDLIEESSIRKYKIGALIGICLFFIIIGFIGFLLFRTKLLFYYLLLIINMFL